MSLKCSSNTIFFKDFRLTGSIECVNLVRTCVKVRYSYTDYTCTYIRVHTRIYFDMRYLLRMWRKKNRNTDKKNQSDLWRAQDILESISDPCFAHIFLESRTKSFTFHTYMSFEIHHSAFITLLETYQVHLECCGYRNRVRNYQSARILNCLKHKIDIMLGGLTQTWTNSSHIYHLGVSLLSTNARTYAG